MNKFIKSMTIVFVIVLATLFISAIVIGEIIMHFINSL